MKAGRVGVEHKSLIKYLRFCYFMMTGGGAMCDEGEHRYSEKKGEKFHPSGSVRFNSLLQMLLIIFFLVIVVVVSPITAM